MDDIIKENEQLKEEIRELKEHLKKYTAPTRNKKFYEEHKEEIISKVKEYNKTHKPSKEQKREYNKRWYEKKKLEKEKIEKKTV
jgi:hypothetical protein